MSNNQIQCPNCGGYDIKPTNTSSLLEMLFTLLGIGLIIPALIMEANQNQRDWGKFMEGKNTAVCQICKREFSINDVPSTPISPNQQLIQAGHQRLKEEEEARRRRNYDD